MARKEVEEKGLVGNDAPVSEVLKIGEQKILRC
jgi:hypothetical protein